MDTMMAFNDPRFGTLRVIIKGGVPWFAAIDVCRTFGLGNTQNALSKLPSCENTMLRTSAGRLGKHGGAQRYYVLTMSGMEALVMKSGKPESLSYMRWISSEVVPTIEKQRLHTPENTIDTLLNDPDFGIRLLSALKAERDMKATTQQNTRPPEIIGKKITSAAGDFRTLVYVCSPLAGDVVQNSDKARRYSRFVLEQGCIPLAPHLLYPQFMDEAVPEERAIGLHIGLELLDRADELWFFGDAISSGMRAEIKEAKRLGMSVRHFSKDGVEVPL